VLGRRVDPGRDRVALDGVPVVVDATVVHWVLNKPAGYVTTAHDTHGRPTVLDLVPGEPRVFPVGRLDLETEGLLLLTNDGDLAQLLTHPRHGVEKEYFVEVEGKPSPAALRRLREGVELDDGPTLPARAKIVQESPALTTTALAIVVKEGRKRMVRRMCATVGHPVVRLARTRIGPLRDPRLAPGTWRALGTQEVRALYTAALDGAAEASE
jgi:23S rRNA pseudouridine2605 synthase